MSKKLLKVLLILSLSIGLTSAAFSQQTGSIRGTIADTENNFLPGVSVTANSPALMTPQNYVTTETGTYRFPALPPGHYDLTAELPGFKTVTREEIIVRVGMVITIDIVMEMTALEEKVTVTATSPTVDVEQTKLSVIMDKELLKNIPMARDLYDIVNAAPGAISEEQTYRRTSSIHGGTVRSNTYAFDGVNMNDPVVMYPLTNINFDVMDEVEMVTAAHPARIGYTDGAYINIVTRSGGNRFSGGAVIYYTNEGMNQILWTEEHIQALEVSKPQVDKLNLDGSLTLGGPVILDRLWFFGNARYIKQEMKTNFIPFTDILGRYHGAYNWIHEEKMGFIKFTSQVTTNIKLMAMYNYIDRYRPMYEEPGSRQPFISTRVWDHETGHTGTALFNYILNQNTFFDIKGSFVRRWFPIPMQPEAQGLPWINDYAEPYAMITTARFNETYLRKRVQGEAHATRFLDDFLGGNHEIKAGVEYEQAYGDWDWWRKDNLLWYWYGGPYYYDTTTWKGVPNVGRGRIYFYICGPDEGSTKIIDKANRIGFYLQDSATFADRLTVNVGVRFDRTTGWKPAVTKEAGGNPMSVWIGENYVKPHTAKTYPDRWGGQGVNPYAQMTSDEWKDIMVWNAFSPRIGMTFDVFGDGRTALKASFARYTEYMMLQYFSTLHSFYPRSFRYYWYDMNNNQLIDTADDFTVYPTDYRVMDPTFSEKKLADGTTSPLNDEFTVGIWHELFKNFSLGMNFIYKSKSNIFEDVRWAPDTNEYWYHWDQPAAKKYWIPFTTIVPGTDDYPDQKVTVYVMSNDAPETFYQARNVPELSRKYWALEFIFNKRMADGWQFSGSVVYSKAYGNIGGWYGVSWGWSGGGDSPNAFVNTDGRQDVDRPLQIKLMGTAQLPYRIFLSAYYRLFTGSPWGRYANIRPPTSWCNANNAYRDYYGVYIEPLDTRQNRGSNYLDLRLEKEFRLGDFGRLGAYIDCLNVLGWSGVGVGRDDIYQYNPSAENVSEPQNVTLESGYKVISSVSGVRTVKFSVRFSF
ncbi:MAG: carboxypeptidase regulatory-like domain-containing protein [Candidatus Aminicenantaceae bacterium]